MKKVIIFLFAALFLVACSNNNNRVEVEKKNNNEKTQKAQKTSKEEVKTEEKKRVWDLTKENPIDHDYYIDLDKLNEPRDYSNSEYEKLNENLYKAWNSEMNEIYTQLLSVLEDEENEFLQTSQNGWLQMFLKEPQFIDNTFRDSRSEYAIEDKVLNGFKVNQINRIRRRTIQLISYYDKLNYNYDFKYICKYPYVQRQLEAEKEKYFSFDIGGEYEHKRIENPISKDYDEELKKINKSKDYSNQKLLEHRYKYDEIWDQELNAVYKVIADKLNEQQRKELLESQMGWIQHHMYEEKFFQRTFYERKSGVILGSLGKIEKIDSHMERIKRRTLELMEYEYYLGGKFIFSYKNTGGKRRVSGRISLPEGYKEDELEVDVSIKSYGDTGDTWYSKIITIGSENSAQFEFYVEEGDYFIKYHYPDIRRVFRYKSGVYIDKNKKDSNRPSIIQVRDKDIEGINMELEETGYFEGTISLPEGEVAGKGGVEISLDSILCEGGRDDGLTSSSTATIKEGENSTVYKLYVNPGLYIIAVDIENYLGSYCMEGGIVGDTEKALRIPVKLNEHKELNIKIPKRERSISGKIVLPKGHTAPSGGMDVKLTAFYGNYSKNDDYVYYAKPTVEEIHIKEGESSATYEIPVGKKEYRLAYEIAGNSVYSDGYYNDSFYTGDVHKASVLDLREGNLDDIKIDIKENGYIKGEIRLAEGQGAPPCGLWCVLTPIRLDEDENFELKPVYIKFEEGQNTAQYELPIQRNEEYIILCSLSNTEDKPESYSTKIKWGYNGFKNNNPDAVQRIEIGENDLEEFIINVDRIYEVNGNVSIDEMDIAPEEGIEVSVTFYRDTDTGEQEEGRYVTIPEGKNNVDFKFYFIGSGKNIVSAKVRHPGEFETRYRLTFYAMKNSGKGRYEATQFYNKHNGFINIQVKKKAAIKGTVFLPKGEVAPKGGIVIILNAHDEKYLNQDVCSVLIPEGKNSMDYELLVGRSTYDFSRRKKIVTEYFIEYDVRDQRKFGSGYYSSKGSALNINEAEKIIFKEKDLENIDIHLVRTR